MEQQKYWSRGSRCSRQQKKADSRNRLAPECGSCPTARPILRIPSMRRKKISAHFALSSCRLKVAVVSSFWGTSWQ
jgi:hypothetical protein